MNRIMVVALGAMACGGSRPVEQPAAPPIAPVELIQGGVHAPSEGPSISNQELTSEAGLRAAHVRASAETVSLKGSLVVIHEDIRAYRSEPEALVDATPGVLLIHDGWGLSDEAKAEADRYAAAGYLALAIDLYGGSAPADTDEAVAQLSELDPTVARKSLEAGLTNLAPLGDRGLGVVGRCVGAHWALEAGLASENVRAVVLQHGLYGDDMSSLEGLRAPVMGIFAEQDEATPAEYIEAFEKAFVSLGASVVVHRYNSPHGFAASASDKYDAELTADVWSKTQTFLGEHLRAAD